MWEDTIGMNDKPERNGDVITKKRRLIEGFLPAFRVAGFTSIELRLRWWKNDLLTSTKQLNIYIYIYIHININMNININISIHIHIHRHRHIHMHMHIHRHRHTHAHITSHYITSDQITPHHNKYV
jgi:hypothetical protein